MSCSINYYINYNDGSLECQRNYYRDSARGVQREVLNGERWKGKY